QLAVFGAQLPQPLQAGQSAQEGGLTDAVDQKAHHREGQQRETAQVEAECVTQALAAAQYFGGGLQAQPRWQGVGKGYEVNAGRDYQINMRQAPGSPQQPLGGADIGDQPVV